jgi:hypothetical protein
VFVGAVSRTRSRSCAASNASCTWRTHHRRCPGGGGDAHSRTRPCITDRFLPDKAIDLSGQSGEPTRMEVDSKPELDELDQSRDQLKIERGR